MNQEHPSELLLAIAEGAMPPPEVRAHLNGCDRCQRVLAGLCPLDLDYVWDGVRAELDAPQPGWLARALDAVGLDPSLVQVVTTTPSLLPAWLCANAAVLLVALVLSLTASDGSVSPGLLVAPLLAAAGVAFAYGPAVDPAYELVATTPASPVAVLLVRLAAVLTVDALLTVGADLAAGFGWRSGLLLPMAAAAVLAAAVAARWTPMAGAAAGMTAWVALLGLRLLAGKPLDWLVGPHAQLAYALATVALLVALLRRVRTNGWSVPAGHPAI